MSENSINAVIEWIVDEVGPNLVVGLPLGLGKPNGLINALYERVKGDPSLSLEIVTALSLNPPEGGSEFERRFLGPFVQRHFGEDYPDLQYVADLNRDALPPNIKVVEFYFQSGSRLRHATAQRAYINSNYTHVARDLEDRGVNVILQAVAAGEMDGKVRLSLSSNPDVTLDLADRQKLNKFRCLMVAQIVRDLPFAHGDAVVETEFFDRVLPEVDQPLFALPHGSVDVADYFIGLNASTLIRDGGTLQIGIGSLSDALVYALTLRHEHNDDYRQLVAGCEPLEREIGGRGTFDIGLYGASEMFMDGFMHLYQAGILRRAVHENATLQRIADQGKLTQCTPRQLIELIRGDLLPDVLDQESLDELKALGLLSDSLRLIDGMLELKDRSTVENDFSRSEHRARLAAHGLADELAPGAVMDGAFFLGTKRFYQWLRSMPEDERRRFRMTSVARINQLYGGNETLEKAQRRHARFVNTCMMMSVTGAACSDALKDHQVVSGVGGQYNFVAMAHAMHEGRSILMLRASRGSRPNVVWEVPHTTIPRHLRDIVVTEYGVADLRGRTDEECIKAMIQIADSRHQGALVRKAKAAGKLATDYRVPARYRRNRHQELSSQLQPYRERGWFKPFPFGCDFDAQEVALGRALKHLKSATAAPAGRVKTVARALTTGLAPRNLGALERMALDQPAGWREKLMARLLNVALNDTRKK